MEQIFFVSIASQAMRVDSLLAALHHDTSRSIFSKDKVVSLRAVLIQSQSKYSLTMCSCRRYTSSYPGAESSGKEFVVFRSKPTLQQSTLSAFPV